MPRDTPPSIAALLARPAHRTLRYAMPGARLHHPRAGYVATEEPENPGSAFGHRLVLPASPFVEGLDAWLDRWRAEPRAARPKRAYFVWETAERDAAAEARAGDTPHVLYVLRVRRIDADRPLRQPPPGPPGLECRPLRGEAEWRAAQALSGAAFGGDDPAHAAFARWAVGSRRTRVEAGQGVDWGAWLDGRLVAHCGLMFDPAGPEARFQDVAAHPGFGGRKIVSNLLVAVARRFFADGGRRAWMLADVDSRPDRIYAALGFAPESWFYELGVAVAPPEAPPG